ncbi:ribbon-helix-helix protein, CopG family [Haloactinomyces albus]|uniref:Ribbon-helix-helix protein CopG domain-containing protein n=1 Tax=Haloactinomyces albus TaxID=1352928 RepID=A0AAE3ZAT7_9ACTN|nr:ribbon-helix-helix protein, CopG family [Haloactinomyces albus]MDR7300226.1 hypothetical protein [Haloactinomyces albus]
MTRYTDGGDIDLDSEEVYDSHGRRITEQYAEEAADYDPTRVRPGRPSLSADAAPGEHSPQLRFRLPPELARRVRELAHREGRPLSDVGREALEEYLARH